MSGTETMGQMYARLLYDKDMNNLLNKYLAGYPLHSPAIEMAENELYNMGMSNMINPKYHPELNAKGALGKTASSIMKGARGAAHLIPIVGAGLTAADIYQGLNQPVGAANIPYEQRLKTASPFEREQLMNINYFGR